MLIALAALAALLLITQAATVAAFLLLGERREQRHAEERNAWVTERRELNQRIQAPEVAVAQAIDLTEDKGFVNPLDDAAYWQAQIEDSRQ